MLCYFVKHTIKTLLKHYQKPNVYTSSSPAIQSDTCPLRSTLEDSSYSFIDDICDLHFGNSRLHNFGQDSKFSTEITYLHLLRYLFNTCKLFKHNPLRCTQQSLQRQILGMQMYGSAGMLSVVAL